MRLRSLAPATLGLTIMAAALGYAQQQDVRGRIWAGGDRRVGPHFATLDDFNGSFLYCRGFFGSNRGEGGGGGWRTDYPGADNNFSVRLGELTKPQRDAALDALAAVLSRQGYQKVIDIMNADDQLVRGTDNRMRFGTENYCLALFGTPSATRPWMLQFGGHHLAINLTMAGAQSSMTPSLPAAQPATYTWEGREIRPLGKENDKAFALVNALDASQRSQAILTYRVADLVLGPGQDGKTIQPEGIRASALSAAQQTMLLDLVREWTGIVTDAFAEPRIADVRAHLSDTYFAWSGPTSA